MTRLDPDAIRGHLGDSVTGRLADFEAFAQMGVDRLVLHMGSQAPARLEARLNDLAQVVRKVA